MDGGTTWTRLEGSGLPTREIGKIALCMSRADSRRVYALIETGDGVPSEGGDTDGDRCGIITTCGSTRTTVIARS